MSWNTRNLESAIQQAMADVRGTAVHPDTAEKVDQTLRTMREAAESMGAGEALSTALMNAEAAFEAGHIKQTIQHLSRALILTTKLEPPTLRKRKQ